MRNKMRSVVAALAFVVMMSPSAVAGGWAVVELGEPVSHVVAGEPVTVTYRVLAHGRKATPVAGIESTIMLTHRETGEVVKANGTTTSDPVVYTATFTLDQPGEWKWMVLAYHFLPDAPVTTAMPTLTVSAAANSLAVSSEHGGTPAASNSVNSDITIDDDGFTPVKIEIPAGSNVTWMNKGTMAHQVMSGDLAFSDSGMLEVGESYSQAFDTPGTYVYSCGPHPWMIGTVVVK